MFGAKTMGVFIKLAPRFREARRELEDMLGERARGVEFVESLSGVTLSSGDKLVVVGDDRDILQTLHSVLCNDIGVLAVSKEATRGFLSQCMLDDLSEALERLQKDQYTAESLRALEVRIDGGGPYIAFNDAALFAQTSATLVEYSLHVDGELIWRDVADGIIIATPLGSSGYSLSVGGPLIHQGANALVISPVNSIDITRRPIVVSGDSTILIEDISSRSGVETIIDGFLRIPIEGEMVVTSFQPPVKYIRLEGLSHIASKIEKKLHLAEELLDAPPSVKLILKTIQYEGPLSYSQLLKKTMLPERTLRHALSILLSRRIIARVPLARDARHKIYYIPGVHRVSDLRQGE
jgi:NAD+ kinase